MPRWSEDKNEFVVKVFSDDKKGTRITLPKPIFEELGRPTKIKYQRKEGKIRIVSIP